MKLGIKFKDDNEFKVERGFNVEVFYEKPDTSLHIYTISELKELDELPLKTRELIVLEGESKYYYFTGNFTLDAVKEYLQKNLTSSVDGRVTE